MRSRKRSCPWWLNRGSLDQVPRRLTMRVLAAGGILASWLTAQPLPPQQSSGQLDVSQQGYALAQQNQVSYIAGPAFQFSEFLPNLGLLSGRLEVLGRDGGVVAGDNYLQLRGPSAFNLRWNLQGGDFRVSSGMVDNIFQNVYYPEITARGVKVEADRPGWRYALFAGVETLLEGPRVPFRSQVPQSVVGATVQRKLSDRWQIGFRALRVWSSAGQIERYPNFFPANRRIEQSTSFTTQSVFSLTKSLKVYGEGGIAATRRLTPEGRSGKLSGFAGLAFENSSWTVKLNYAYQTTSYLPLLGYFAGDRRGPFGELRFRPWRSVDVFASSSSYNNNLEGDPRVPVFQSRATSAGGVLRLPWKLSLNGEMTDLRFSSSASETTEPALSTSRQLAASLARPVKRQTLRVGYRDLTLGSSLPSNRQRSIEVEDTLQLKRISLGGAVRLQQTVSVQSTRTVYARGFVQVHLGRLTGYAEVENGNDLLNRTLFATSNFRTMVAGVTAPLWHGWNLQVEAFRNRLTTELNPENAFFQAGEGIPAQLMLAGFNQRSVYFRLFKHFTWGGPVPAGGIDRYADDQTRLRGPVRGTIRSLGTGGTLPAADVAVVLDGSRTVLSGETGVFVLPDVLVGIHSVALAVRELPADYDPGPAFEAMVQVDPGRNSTVTLEVWRLGSIRGIVASTSSLPREWAAPPGAVRAIHHRRCRRRVFLRQSPGGRVRRFLGNVAGVHNLCSPRPCAATPRGTREYPHPYGRVRVASGRDAQARAASRAQPR